MSERAGRLVLLDSFGLIYRAFFALPPMNHSNGQPTNAVLGFTTMLARIIAQEKPTYLVAAFDRGIPAARMTRCPGYKAQRERMPDELRSQIPLVRQVLQAYAIPIVELENEEADDILATLAHKAERAHEVRVITGDLDLLQIVDERVTVVVTKRGIGELTIYDPAAVQARFGLSPSQLADYRGLKGDPSDNLTGIPGIGEKTAIKLIAAAGSLDALLADPSQAGTAKLQQLLREHAETARMCRDVSVVQRDLDVDVPWDEAHYFPPSNKALAGLYREMEFRQLLVRLDPHDLAEIPTTQADESVPEVTGQYTHYGQQDAQALENLQAALWALHQAPRLAFIQRDKEFGIAWAHGEALSFDCALLEQRELREMVLALVANVADFMTHDAKALFALWRPEPNADGFAYRRTGTAQAGLFDIPAKRVELAPRAVADDTMIAAYLLNPAKSYASLADAAADVLSATLSTATAGWADAIWRIAEHARLTLAERHQTELYEQVELPAVTLLASMEAAGIALDLPELQTLAREIDREVELKRRDIFALAGEEFNLGSPQQLGRILFEKLALPHGKRNKTGYATGVEVLTGLAEKYEIAQRMLEYREVAKLKNTYVDVLPNLVDGDGRLRTLFNQTATTTGRLSSTSPNLQNIPVRGELGRGIRKAFVASKAGSVLLAADYSQIELRLMAHLSADEAMCAAFVAGHDIHQETARKIFGLPESEQSTAEQRRIAKSVNFGLLYGMGDFGLAQRLGITRSEAHTLVEAYFQQFPGVRGYLQDIVRFGREHGYVETLAGRRRYLPDLLAREHIARAAAEREATNAPLQGGAADLVKIAMIRVGQALSGYDAKLLLQIHDELILEVPEAVLPAVATIVRKEMVAAMTLRIPLEVTIKTGRTWYDVAAYDEQTE